MKRIQCTTTQSTRPTPLNAGAVGYFGHANPITNTPSTQIPVDWLNDIDGSFDYLFTQTGTVGVGGSAGDRNLYDAINYLVSPKIDSAYADGRYVKLSGSVMTGLLYLSGDPTTNLGAATKQYADTKLALSGGTLTNFLTLHANPTSNLHAATKQYVDSVIPVVPPAGISQGFADGRYVYRAGDTMTGYLTLNAAPTSSLHAVTKGYADQFFPIAGGTINGTTIFNTGVAVQLGRDPVVNMDAATKQYVDSKIPAPVANTGGPGHYYTSWTDQIDVATPTFLNVFGDVKSVSVPVPANKSIATIFYTANAHNYSDGTISNGFSIIWQLVWNGTPVGHVYTNQTFTDNCVFPIIFTVPVPVVNQATTANYTLTLRVKVCSDVGRVVTNHGQFQTSGEVAKTEINIIFQ